MARHVKSAAAALSRTEAPVVANDGLANLVSGMGTSKDKRSYSQYFPAAQIDRGQLESMYRSSWLAKRIVNSVADDMTREGWKVQFDDSQKKNRLAIERCEKRLGLRKKINEALKWARLYGGAIIVIGTKGSKDLSLPLDITKVKKGDLRYLHVMDRWRVSASATLCTDLDSPNFGKPDGYIIAESSITAHYSRVLRFDGQPLPYFLLRANANWHDSELQHTYSALQDCDASTAALATMMFEANVDVVTSEGLNQLLSTKGGEATAAKRFELAALMKSINRMLLLDGKESYDKKTTSFANLDKIVERFMINACGAADIPMTRLFGQAAAGMSATGESDMRNYYDMVDSKRETDVRPALEYLYEIMCRSELGTMPDDFDFDFGPLWQVSATEQGTIDYQRAQTDQIYLNGGVLHEAQIGRSLKDRGTYPELTDEDIDMLQELVDTAPPPAAPPVAAPGAILPSAPPIDPAQVKAQTPVSPAPTTKAPK